MQKKLYNPYSSNTPISPIGEALLPFSLCIPYAPRDTNDTLKNRNPFVAGFIIFFSLFIDLS
jgi:hypothetical protein